MAFQPEEDLSCPICHEVFKEPVVLSCSHSFCNDCVKSWWWDKQTCECPVCKAVSQTRKPPRNLALKNLCEAFLSRGTDSNAVCGLHSEKFKLFCLDHQAPVCVICRDSEAHSNHRFRPIDETAQESKNKVQIFLKPIRRRLKRLEEAKNTTEEMTIYIKLQAEYTERQINEEFRKLYRFLQKEEKVRTSALKNEEKIKSKRMRGNMEDLRREIIALSDIIRVTEEEMRGDNVSFLRNYKAVVKRIQESYQLHDPGPFAGDLIDVAKHLGNLTSPIWTKMKKMVSFTPVGLDPNTAHPHLTVSADLTSVRFRKRLKVPKNPERIDYFRCVLGSQGFDSGSHVWDVDVGDSNHWALGAAAKSAYQEKNIKSGLWIITFERDEYSALSPSKSSRLQIQKKLKKIRIHLKCDRRSLLFFDLETGQLIHSFTHVLAKILFPYFSNGRRSPLKILPQLESARVPPLIVIIFIVMATAMLLVLTTMI